jgi:NAD(P)-dependent dehydrogenase (short-subunit alcohol dehydrogenase family)
VNRLADRYQTALVTGASTGLGRATAEMLLAEGVRVWGTARDPARLPALQGLAAVALDLDSDASVDAAFAEAEHDAGGLDLVVNNAGYGLFGDFAGLGFAGWQRQLDTMLVRTLRLSHLALRAMLARNRGALVNVSSLAAEFPLPFMSGYNVVKSGLAAFSESLMIEVAGTGIIVIDFRPGDYRTGFNQTMQTISEKHLPAGTVPADRRQRAWTVLDANLRGAPPPARAAADLRRALRRHRSGTIRSGTFFQARLAPLLVRFIPLGLRRAALARYFGCS